MPQTTHEDLERANNADSEHTKNGPSQPPVGASSFGDSSGSLFSIYSKAAEEEDNKMVERWQKDADGILIFTGLFSAAVAALLTVTVQDLRPNIQDTSAFYLGNIYQVLADPNVTHPSIPSPIAKPPQFTPPRYSIWVNSLWFLSLVMSLSCALLATSWHQGARRYLRLAQPARCSPEKRARMRAFFANGVEKMHVPWAVEGLPTLLHLSLFLFFGGLVILLFNVNHEVFSYVIWWIGLFSIVYASITLLPIMRHDSPYNSPLSTPAWFLYASINHITFKILAFVTPRRSRSVLAWWYFKTSRDRYRRWMLGGVEKAAEETASERSSEIDSQILDWTISALGDDESLMSFFEAIPGFFNSKLVQYPDRYFSVERLQKFRDALSGFLGRTWSSNSVDDSEKLRRLDVSMNAMNQFDASYVWFILHKIFFDYWDEMPQTVETGHVIARWCTSSDQSVARYAQIIVTRILQVGGVQKRDCSWITLATRVSGLPEHDLRDNITYAIDNVLLAILIQVINTTLHSVGVDSDVLQTLSELDIRNTLPGLQHDFCTLWDRIVQEAGKQGPSSTPFAILGCVYHLHVTLHQVTDAALLPPPTDDSNVPPQAEQTDIIAPRPAHSNPTKTGEIGGTPQGPNTTQPIHPAFFSPYPTDGPPTGGMESTSQTSTLTTTSSHSQEGNEQRDIVAPCAEPETSSIISTQTLTPTLVPTSTPPLPKTSLESCNSGPAAASNSLLAATSENIAVGFSNPVSPPQSHVPLVSSPSTEFIALLSTSDATLPHPRVRGLANSGKMGVVNAVLQTLVHSPPFWDLFKKLDSLKGQRGGGIPETDGGMTPLVDATTTFIGEFLVKEKESTPVQQPPRQIAVETRREDVKNLEKEHNHSDPFAPTYMYDAMKEKRQLNDFLVSQKQDAERFYRIYLDALDEELLTLLRLYERPASTIPRDDEVSQSGQAEVGDRGSMCHRQVGGTPGFNASY